MKQATIPERIKNLSSGPSMVPQSDTPKPPPKKEQPVIKDLSDFISKPKVRLEMARTLERIGEIKDIVRPLDKEKEKLTNHAKRIAGEFGIDKAIAGDFVVDYLSIPRTVVKVDALKVALLSRGITLTELNSILSECTTTTDGLTLRVRRINQGDDNG